MGYRNVSLENRGRAWLGSVPGMLSTRPCLRDSTAIIQIKPLDVLAEAQERWEQIRGQTLQASAHAQSGDIYGACIQT